MDPLISAFIRRRTNDFCRAKSRGDTHRAIVLAAKTIGFIEALNITDKISDKDMQECVEGLQRFLDEQRQEDLAAMNMPKLLTVAGSAIPFF